MQQIEVFAEIVCPFTHVGLRRLVEARKTRGADDQDPPIRVRAWPLELINEGPPDRALLAREVEALRSVVAPDLFMGFDAHVIPRTSMPAFGLAAAAYDRNAATGETVSVSLRDALFEDGADLADRDVIAQLAERFDIEPFDAPAADAAARADWTAGRARGVRGSPHFFVGTEDWFCPTLDIAHEGERFDVRTDAANLREFYSAVFG